MFPRPCAWPSSGITGMMLTKSCVPWPSRARRRSASMGIDAPLACLSKKTRSFFDYFYQLFAQVTNPPIDALREHMVTSTTLYLGNHGNLLEDSRTACQLVRLERPLLSEEEFERIARLIVLVSRQRFRAVYRRDAGEGALQAALESLPQDVEAAVRDGVNIVVLSDRAAAEARYPCRRCSPWAACTTT